LRAQERRWCATGSAKTQWEEESICPGRKSMPSRPEPSTKSDPLGDFSLPQHNLAPGALFDSAMFPDRFVNLENNKLTSLGLMSFVGMEMPASLQ
jgi:hypothetical protein